MIEKLYSKYFQKSRSFLYPALGIKKNAQVSPMGTYICIKEKIEPEDIKFICTFKKDTSDTFIKFENQMLLSNPLFEQKIEAKDRNIYVFDFEIYKKDWFNFIMGKYSQLSPVLKRAIKSYYGENSSEYKFIETYLYPEKYFETYSKLLEIDVETLMNIGELCDPCDLEKETLKIPIENLESLEKTN